MFYIFRNKETGEITEGKYFRNDTIQIGEITEGKYFRNDTIQIINPTNEVLEKYGWEILDDYPIIEDEETDEPDETPMSEIEIESEV